MAECENRFQSTPRQICTEWNTAAHLASFEGKPARRPFDYEELQTLFDVADARVDSLVTSGRKGALAALRDAQLLKTTYAFGLRRGEVARLEIADLRANPSMPRWGRYGAIQVRFGKSSNGGPPKRRTVLGVPQFEWAIEGMRQWVEDARDRFGFSSPSLWLTERRGRLSERSIDDRFLAIRDEAGLPRELSLHSLRHSYVTHLIEHGYSERFVQEQVGHSYSSTTAIYTSVGDQYRHAAVRKALTEYYQESD